MTLPAEDTSTDFEDNAHEAQQESAPSSTPEPSETTTETPPVVIDPEVETLIKKVGERPTEYTHVKFQENPTALQALFKIIGSSTLLRSDLFLSVLALTLLNALIFIHYARTSQSAYDLKTANAIIREDLGKDYDFMEPITDFVNFHGEFKTPTHPQFSSSLGRLRAKLGKFGLDADGFFFQDEFLQKNGGLYWARKSDRSPTAYQPSIQ